MDYLVWPTEKIRSRVREAAHWSPSCRLLPNSNPKLVPWGRCLFLSELWRVILSLNYKRAETIFYPSYSISRYNEQHTYELGALESSVSKADIALALLAHTAWQKLGGLKQKLKKILIKHSHRETFVQLASCMPQPKAGIPSLLPTPDPGQL